MKDNDTVQLERALLRAVWSDKTAYEKLVDLSFSPLELKKGLARVLYGEIAKVHDEDKTPDITLISHSILQTPETIRNYLDVEYSVESVPEYLQQIRTQLIADKINELGLALQESEFDTLEEIRVKVDNTLKSLTPLEQGTSLKTANSKAILSDLVKKSNDNKNKPLSEVRIQVPFGEYTKRFGGLFLGDYTIIAGDTSIGKTAMAATIYSYALSQGIPVATIILEMSEEQVLQREIARRSGISMRELRELTFYRNPRKTQRWENAVAELNEIPNWYLFGTENNRLDMVLSKIRAAAKAGVKLVVVDYVQLISYPEYSHSRPLEIGLASQALQNIAKQLNIHVIGVAQLNRANNNRQDKRPLLTDLKDSSLLEQSADNVWLLYRDAYFDPETEVGNQAELNQAKGRNSGTGIIYSIEWNPETMTFIDTYESQEEASWI